MPQHTSDAPSYDLYKDQYARVIIDRKSIHLGRYGSEKSRAKYKRLIAEWTADQAVGETNIACGPLLGQVLEAYGVWALKHFGDKPRGRYRNMLQVIKAVRETYADIPANEFSPKKLKVVRQVFINRGNCRRQVNDSTRDVVAIFRWASEEELVPGSIVESIKQVRPLQRGRCNVREGRPVEAVAESVVDATLEHLTPVVADMVRLQLTSGARPGEICSLTPSQINRSGDVWHYRPAQHKTLWKGRERVVCFGPQAQEILRRYLLRPADSPCFSPREALAQHFDQRHEERKTPMSCGNTPSGSKRQKAIVKVGEQYDIVAYRKAIHRACDRAFPAPERLEGKALRDWKQKHRWSPNRLRHTAATRIREQFGLDGAQAILGHAQARVTEVYGELNIAKATEIARQIG